MLTRQQIFDQSVLHLRRQGSRAYGLRMSYSQFQFGQMTNGCCYRMEDGRGCAMAPFIEDYKPTIEGFCANDEPVKAACPKIDWQSEVTVDLLIRLQSIHDSHQPDQWPELWCKAAQDFSLNAYAVCQPL